MKTIIFCTFLFATLNLTFGGQKLPEFKLMDVNNQWQTYSDIKGQQLTVIDFWATWCSPCAKALPKLNTIYEFYKDKGVQFIGLNIDSPRNSAKVKPFVNAYKIQYPVLKDPNGELPAQLNISSIPTLLIIDKNNEIIYRHQGYRSGDEDTIKAEIEKLLSEGSNE